MYKKRKCNSADDATELLWHLKHCSFSNHKMIFLIGKFSVGFYHPWASAKTPEVRLNPLTVFKCIIYKVEFYEKQRNKSIIKDIKKIYKDTALHSTFFFYCACCEWWSSYDNFKLVKSFLPSCGQRAGAAVNELGLLYCVSVLWRLLWKRNR